MRECLGVGVGVSLFGEVKAGDANEGTLSREVKEA